MERYRILDRNWCINQCSEVMRWVLSNKAMKLSAPFVFKRKASICE